jgi:hypothetical protein
MRGAVHTPDRDKEARLVGTQICGRSRAEMAFMTDFPHISC